MMTTQKILVRRYVRRYPKTPKKTIEGAFEQLHRLKADKDLKDVCWVQATEEDSRVMENPRVGFRRNACSVVNLEPQDVQDEVAAATTIFHESVHARHIAKGGKKAITKGHEVIAHKETITFLKDWQAKENRQETLNGIKRELGNEKRAIDHYKHHD
jgi:hypothetical protein